MSDAPILDDDDSWLRLPEVRRRTGLSKTEIYRRMGEDRFPKCHKLSPRVTVWLCSQIRSYVRAPFLDNEARELL